MAQPDIGFLTHGYSPATAPIAKLSSYGNKVLTPLEANKSLLELNLAYGVYIDLIFRWAFPAAGERAMTTHNVLFALIKYFAAKGFLQLEGSHLPDEEFVKSGAKNIHWFSKNPTHETFSALAGCLGNLHSAFLKSRNAPMFDNTPDSSQKQIDPLNMLSGTW